MTRSDAGATLVGLAVAATVLVGAAAARAQGQSAQRLAAGPEGGAQLTALAGDEIRLTLPAGVELVMERIPAGTFLMGSPEDERGRNPYEGPQHLVTLTRDLYMGRCEVTQAQWEAVVGSNPSSGQGIGPDHPVNEVSIGDIIGGDGFLVRLNQHLVATAQVGDETVRLPTEAEWEYAARSGTTTRFSFGDALECEDGCGDCELSSAYMVWCGNGSGHSEPVGQRLANAWGLHDMHGNLWEWTSSWTGTYTSEPQVDPQGPDTGEYKVFRGGAYTGGAEAARSASRMDWHHTSCRARNIGFRVAMTAGSGGPAPAHWAMPAVARAPGSGAFFTSRIELFNAGAATALVDVVYTPRADIGGSGLGHAVTVPAGVLLEVQDPLGQWFGFDDGDAAIGSLLLTVGEGSPSDVMVQSTVFARLPDGSEYGQFFPAQPVGSALTAGESAYLVTTEDPAHNRVNCGIMALADDTEVTITPVGPIGSALAEAQVVTLDRGGSSQVNDVHAQMGLGDLADLVLEVEVGRGSALAYVSVLDGVGEASGYPGTSDPTTILPVQGGAAEVTLLVMGSVQGYDEFSGSGCVTNHSQAPAGVEARFFAAGEPGELGFSTLQLGAGETVGFGDMADELFGIRGSVGTVVLTATDGGLISASGREFAVFRDAAGEVVGTAGQLIPGLTAERLLRPGATYHVLGLRQRQWSGGLERSHVAAFNPGDTAVEVTVAAFDGASGALEGQVAFSVAAEELVQRTNILEWLAPGQDGACKRLEVTVNGPVHLQAFRVNRNGDPITIAPVTAAAQAR